MNYYIALIVFGLLIYLIYYQVKIWKLRVALSPAFYFAVIWSFGLFGLLILSPIGLVFEPYPQYIDELNILIGFTALCFTYFTPKGKKTINKDSIGITFCSTKAYRFLCVLFIAAAIYDFIRLGGSFNVGGARSIVHSILESRPTWIGYIQLLSLPLSIYAGTNIISILAGKRKTNIQNNIYLALPLLGNLIFSLNTGGRVDFIYSFAQYFIGIAIGLPLAEKLSVYKKYFKYLLGCAIFIIFFISVIGSERSDYNQYRSDSRDYFEKQNVAMRLLYGPVEYILSSYNGYQLRRVDAVDKNTFGYGRYTFNGFINWTLPFAGQLGLNNASIAKMLNIYYNNQETYDFERELFYTTHSGYLTIIKDFGFYGAFLCIAFLTWISQRVFINIQKKKILHHAYQLFFFFLFWNYWAKSNFYGTLSSTIMIPLYGFLIIDITNSLFKSNKAK